MFIGICQKNICDRKSSLASTRNVEVDGLLVIGRQHIFNTLLEKYEKMSEIKLLGIFLV